jgi:GT2 family glycosyltransferase
VVNTPLLSIVVTAYTTERLNDIFELLDSIKTQTYHYLEIIFVAERSQDLFVKVKSYAGENRINVKMLFNSGEAGLSAARNIGIRESKGEIVAFIDDDTVLFPTWAEETIKAYKDDSIIGITGPALPLWEDTSMSWFPEELYWIISCTGWSGWTELKEVRNAWGMNMSFRREAFDKSGLFLNEFGYHKGLMAEDNEFSLRVRQQTAKRIMYCPSARVMHRVHRYRLSTKFIKERAYWIGYSRRTLKKQTVAGVDKLDVLGQEHDLLKRILSDLLPNILKISFTHPVTAWHKLKVTIIALTYVTLGYSIYFHRGIKLA